MIRFQRIGRKNDPAFRMLVLEKTSGPKAGTYVEQVGTYNPKTKDFAADGAKIKEWMVKGAQVSPSLSNLLITKGILEGKKVNVLPKKSPIAKPVDETAAAPAAVAEAPAAEAAPEVVAEATPEAEVAAAVEEAVEPEAVEGAPAEEVAA